MYCRHCGHRFRVNYQVDHAPGGQESPGLFFMIGALFMVGGIVLHVTVGTFWQWVGYSIAGFVWLQCLVSLADCRQVPCPKCGRPARVVPWSF